MCLNRKIPGTIPRMTTFLFRAFTIPGEVFDKYFCKPMGAPYLSSINDNDMKKIALVMIAALLVLASCSKQAADLPVAPPTTAKFFSRIQYFKDGRTPATDTVWTLHLFNQQMVDSFARYDGLVYWESTTVKEVGRLWSK